MDKQFKKQLAELARTSRQKNQDMRFGQLLYNAIARHDLNGRTMDIEKGADYESDFHARLFYIEDDELAKIIEAEDD